MQQHSPLCDPGLVVSTFSIIIIISSSSSTAWSNRICSGLLARAILYALPVPLLILVDPTVTPACFLLTTAIFYSLSYRAGACVPNVIIIIISSSSTIAL